jgi:hypothetical protein
MRKAPRNTPTEQIRRELERLAELEPSSGRAAIAKATALRTLLRLEERGKKLSEAEERLWAPDRDEDERVREDDWHPTGEPFAELDAWDTVGARRRWWLGLRG